MDLFLSYARGEDDTFVARLYPEAPRALAGAIGSHPVEARWNAVSEAIDVLTTLPREEFAVRAATLTPLITSLGDNEPIEQLA